MPDKHMEYFRMLFDHLAWIEHQVLSSIRDSRKVGGAVSDDERWGRSKAINTPKLIGQRVSVRLRVTMLRFLGSPGRDSVGRGQHSSNRVSGISTRTMHQSTTPSLSQTICARWASREFLSLPIVQILVCILLHYYIYFWTNTFGKIVNPSITPAMS